MTSVRLSCTLLFLLCCAFYVNKIIIIYKRYGHFVGNPVRYRVNHKHSPMVSTIHLLPNQTNSNIPAARSSLTRVDKCDVSVWDDEDRYIYCTVLNTILQRKCDNSSTITFVPDYTCGFTNAARAMRSFLLLSILHKEFCLYIDWDYYFTVMDSTFAQYRVYNKSSLSKSIDHSYVRAIERRLRRKDKFHIIWNTIRDYSLEMMGRTSNLNGLLNREFPREVILRIISRMVIRPNAKTKAIIDKFSPTIRKKPTLGIHLRMGGSLANVREPISFIQSRDLPNVFKTLIAELKKFHPGNSQLIVASDSSRTKAMIEIQAANLTTLLHLPLAPIGHTLMGTKYLCSAIVDMVLLSKCEYIISTKMSSYGLFAQYMSMAKNSKMINNKGTLIPIRYMDKEINSRKFVHWR